MNLSRVLATRDGIVHLEYIVQFVHLCSIELVVLLRLHMLHRMH